MLSVVEPTTLMSLIVVPPSTNTEFAAPAMKNVPEESGLTNRSLTRIVVTASSVTELPTPVR